MSRSSVGSRARGIAAKAAVVGIVAGGAVCVLPATQAQAATCSDVDVSFARGTLEFPGTGLAGGPFISSLTSALAGKSVSSYAVNYAADIPQTSSGAGSADLVNHVTSVAGACPNTVFVIGGYSQGATVVSKAIGLNTIIGGTATVLPASVAPRVKAVVVFGNPLGLAGQTIETASPTYGGRAKSFCNDGDPVCGGGANVIAHLTYGFNGSAATGATFAAAKVNAG